MASASAVRDAKPQAAARKLRDERGHQKCEAALVAAFAFLRDGCGHTAR